MLHFRAFVQFWNTSRTNTLGRTERLDTFEPDENLLPGTIAMLSRLLSRLIQELVVSLTSSDLWYIGTGHSSVTEFHPPRSITWFPLNPLDPLYTQRDGEATSSIVEWTVDAADFHDCIELQPSGFPYILAVRCNNVRYRCKLRADILSLMGTCSIPFDNVRVQEVKSGFRISCAVLSKKHGETLGRWLMRNLRGYLKLFDRVDKMTCVFYVED